MPADDTAQGEHIQGEQQGAEHRALGDTTGDWLGLRFCSSQGNAFSPISEVGLEPVQGGVGEADGGLKAV